MAPAVIETAVVKVADIGDAPWQVLEEEYQLEAQRCWAERSNGKVKGFIANLLPEAAAEEAELPPFEIAKLRRQWRANTMKEEKKRQEEINEDPYAVLGVRPNSTMAEIKKAYLKKARECHPDKKDGDSQLFQDVLLAYRILKDDTRRENYEESGTDIGDNTQKVQKIKVPDLNALRAGILEHDELYLAPGYQVLADMVGIVQFDYPERLLTQAVFDLGEKGEMVAWLPRQILSIVNEDGSETPISGDTYQREGLVMRARENKLLKLEKSKQMQIQAVTEYVVSWKGVPKTFKEIGHAQAFFKRGREIDGGVLLDLGCGDGEASLLFTQKGRFQVVFGLDNNRTALFEARETAELEGLGPKKGLYLIRGDAQKLPFRDQQVDNVWWGNGWSSVESPKDVLKEVFRVLRPGGRFSMSTNMGVLTAKAVTAALEETGFQAVSIYPPRYGVFINYASRPLPE